MRTQPTHARGGYAAAVLAVLATVLAPRLAAASGFALIDHSARLMGSAYAGTAAVADDAATEFYNPAGLTRIPYASVVGVGTGFIVGGSLNATTSTTLPEPLTVPVTGSNGKLTAHPGQNALTAAFHIAQRINDSLVFGFGVTAPFGLQTKYSAASVARFIATKSKVVTYNINPNIAWKIVDGLSIGAGFDAQYITAALNQELPIPGLPPISEGTLRVSANDWSFGGNAGVLYEFSPESRVGLAYRSQIHHDLSGTAKVSDFGTIPNGNATAPITLPDSITLSGVHAFNAEWELLADLAWTHWATFDRVHATFNNGLPPVTLEENFRNVWRGALGAQFRPTEEWAMRFGVAFDQSPVTDANRTARIPDANRFILACGFGYNVTNHIAIDLSYFHAILMDGTINQTTSSIDKSHLEGFYSDLTADLIALQVTYNIDHWWPISL